MQPHTHLTGLNAIVTAAATRLLSATSSTAGTVSTEVLADLVNSLDVDVCFLRHNDHTIRATILVAEWPPRPDKPDPDPLHTIYFADADAVFALAENAKEPVILRPSAQDEKYRRTVSAGGRSPAISLAAVPLLSGGVTTGVLGFVKFGDRAWNDDEL